MADKKPAQQGIRAVFAALGEREGLIQILSAIARDTGFNPDDWLEAFQAEQERIRKEGK